MRSGEDGYLSDGNVKSSSADATSFDELYSASRSDRHATAMHEGR